MQQCGNPLYLQWVSEWMQEAKEKNQKSYNVFKTAYNSLLSCPITFSEPSEARKLKGIGHVICARIEKRLKEYQLSHTNNKDNNTNLIQDNNTNIIQDKNFDIQSELYSDPKIIQKSRLQNVDKTRTSKTYIPSYKSKPFSILIALFELNKDIVSKEEILNIAKHYHDTSDYKNFYSLWHGMKILLEKEYVYKTNNPTRYSLTDSGKEIATIISNIPFPKESSLMKHDYLLYIKNSKEKNPIDQKNSIKQLCISKNNSKNIEKNECSKSDIIENLNQITEVTKEKSFKIIPNSSIKISDLNTAVIQQNSYSIILLLDMREMKTKKDKDFIQHHLEDESINFEFRTLELGDILWIARCNATEKEYILDFIIERKKLSDLSNSIKDGRFHEQKNYNYDSADLQVETIHSAISSIQIVNGFFVKRVSGLTETIKYIARLSRYISDMYKTQDLYIIPNDYINSQTYTLQKSKFNSIYPERSYVIEYNTFSDFLSKTASLTLGDLFLKMLLTIKGVSPEKALEIQKHFPTLNDLLTSYSKETSEYEREIMIAKKCTNYGRKNISCSLSSKIYKVFQ
ncbi:hypothetical protein PCANB_001409 [Pneumocystis canis]|nr:hypothetical protein PCANB_001409 [Pneumocystis canis]